MTDHSFFPRGKLVFDSEFTRFSMGSSLKHGYETVFQTGLIKLSDNLYHVTQYLKGAEDQAPYGFRPLSSNYSWMRLYATTHFIFTSSSFLMDGMLFFTYPESRQFTWGSTGLLRYRSQKEFESIEYGLMNFFINYRMNQSTLLKMQSNLLFGINRWKDMHRGVNIMIEGTIRGTTTDGNGYFVLPGLLPGTVTLEFMHIGYDKKSMIIQVGEQNKILSEIALNPKVLEMQDVSIVAQKSELADLSLESGHRAVTAEAIRRIPTSRDDVFRAIKHLPGIEGIDPISPLYAVRGSDTGENLILLDGVPIYNPYHFVSSSGLFNVYAIKDVEMMVGGFGVEYGGRNSSVLYITTREGNNKKLHGEIAPSTTYTNAVVDFPIGRNGSMMMSGRWYCNLISDFLFDMPNYFYDVNTTLTWKLNERNRLTVRYFHSFDDVDFKSTTYFNYLGNTFDTDLFDDYHFKFKTRWRNQAISGMMKTILTPNIYWQTQIFYSTFSANNVSLLDYQYTAEDDQKTQLYMETDLRSKIHDLGVHTKMDICVFEWNQLKIGGEWNRYKFENNILLNSYNKGKLLNKPSLAAIYCEDKISLGPLSIRPGIRISWLDSKLQFHPEYRFNIAYRLTDQINLKAAWGEYLQYIVSINTQEYELSQYLDTYFPLGNRLPSESHQTIVGLEMDLLKGVQATLDLYFKDIKRTYDYDYNVSPLEVRLFTEKLREGNGEAYGLELLIKGSLGRTSGWISYSLSKSTRRFPHIMNNKSHLFDYDRPQGFKVVLNHQINSILEFSGSLNVLSGMVKTLETSHANYFYYDPMTNEIGSWPHVITPVKNNIRMPYLLQLDFGLKKRIRKGFGANLARFLGADKAFLNLSISNLLFAFHRNVWFYIQLDETLYGIGTNYFPAISYGYSILF